MKKMILDTKALPELLLMMINSEKVQVSEVDGVINLAPISEFDADGKCPLLGILKGSNLTVDKFTDMTHDEVELTT